MASTLAQSEGTLTVMLRALRSRNYRLFFCGQLVSLVGTWMAQVAMSWLVYDLTGSKMLLGTVAFASQVPAFLLGPWAGVLIDRWNLRRLLVVTQTLSMVQAFILAWLTLAQVIQPWHLKVLAAALGLINAFDMPARQAFVVQMVERREDWPNAIALNSSMFNVSRLVGPAVAGVLLASFGAGICFFLNGISFLAVIAALLAMKVAPRKKTATHRAVLHEFSDGVRYVAGSVPIRVLLLHLAIISLLGTPYTILLPAVAHDVLHGGPPSLGILTSSIGCGALVAAMLLASRRSVVGLGRWIAAGALFMGLALIGFSFSDTLWLSAPMLAISGFAFLTQMASCNTMLQTIVDDDKRGRVMSLHIMAFQGMMPLGSLLAGRVAESHLGIKGTILLCGIGCLAAGAWFLRSLPMLRRHVAPIYRAKGILPPVAEGLREADRAASEKSVSG